MAKQSSDSPVLEKAPEKVAEKLITLRAVYGKQQGSVKIRPVFDTSIGRLFTGQEMMTDDEKRKAKLVIDENTTYTLSDGVVLNLSQEAMAIHWKWMQRHPYIAESFDAAQSLPLALFYVEDIEKEMDKKATKRDQIYQALKEVKESSEVKKAEIMRLLGQKSAHFTPRQVVDYLEDLAMNKPERILEAYSDKRYKERLLLYKLMDQKVINYENKVYKYEGNSIGLTEDQAIDFLSDPRNADIVGLLKQRANG